MTEAEQKEVFDLVARMMNPPESLRIHVRNGVAEALDAIADEVGVAIDLIAGRTWLTAGVDLVLTAITGHTLGTWAKKGIKELSKEVRAARTLAGSTRQLASEILGPSGLTYFAVFGPAIMGELEGTPAARRDRILTASAPHGAEEFAAWALSKSAALGMSLSDFLVVRANLLGGGAE